MRPVARILLASLYICVYCQAGRATMHRVPSQYSAIQTAINASTDGDTVLVDDGTYFENIRYNGKHIVIGSQYVLDSDTAHISRTIINGGASLVGDSGSVVYFVNGEDTTSVLCGLTITGGTGTKITPGVYFPSDMVGGGIYVSGAGARISHTIVTGNLLSTTGSVGLYGAGIGCSGSASSPVIIEYCSINHNSISTVFAHSAGGGIIVASSIARIEHCSITDNTVSSQTSNSNANGGGIATAFATLSMSYDTVAGNRDLAPNCPSGCWGGGVHAFCTDLQFTHNIVVDNVVQTAGTGSAYGGGLSVIVSNEFPGGWPQGDIVIESNLFSGNRANGGGLGSGGGIYVANQKPLIENNIVARNTAYSGGGVGLVRDNYTPSSTPTLMNNTITENRAMNGLGGGIIARGAWIPRVINSIVWGDTGTSEIAGLLGSSLRIFYSDIKGGWVPDTGNIDADPSFVPGDTLFHLLPGSTCIGRGTDSVQIAGILYRAPALDYSRLPRPMPDTTQPVDMGAQEEQITLDVPQSAGIPTSYVLEQNYPNPFNPVSTIGFSIAESRFVTLKVYDLLGREVATLVDERKAPGHYRVEFDASGLASGVYFYSLTAGEYVMGQKMILMK